MTARISAMLVFAVLAVSCGGEEAPGEFPTDSTSTGDASPDSPYDGEDTLRSAAEDIPAPNRASSGAIGLMDEARSVAEDADRHIEELQQTMKGQ